MRLWEKAKKNARNSLHSITIRSSTLGKRAIDDGALQGVENDITRKNYVPSFKNSCPGIKMLSLIESKPVKVFVMNICDMVACFDVICIV